MTPPFTNRKSKICLLVKPASSISQKNTTNSLSLSLSLFRSFYTNMMNYKNFLILFACIITVDAGALRGSRRELSNLNSMTEPEETMETQDTEETVPVGQCANPFGNPCGPGRACTDTDTGFTCSPPINLLGCPVGCGQNSECVDGGSTSGFNCECLEGFSRPRPFLSWGQNASSKIDYPSKPLWITSSPQAS